MNARTCLLNVIKIKVFFNVFMDIALMLVICCAWRSYYISTPCYYDAFLFRNIEVNPLNLQCNTSYFLNYYNSYNIYIITSIHPNSNAPFYLILFTTGNTTEAVTRICSVKRVFLEILQNSQENAVFFVSSLVQVFSCGFCS